MDIARDYSIICNPKLQRYGASQVAKYIETEMGSPPVHSLTTRGPGDASALSKEIIEDGRTELLFLVGGDGTLNEAIQPLVNSGICLCVVPAGTGCDFARSLGIFTPADAIRSVRSGTVMKVDAALCRWNDKSRYFVNIMELGLGALVMKRVNSSVHRGKHIFTTSVIKELMHLRLYSITIGTEQGQSDFITPEVVIANGMYFGRGMRASPTSVMDDGILDIHVVGKSGRFTLMRKLNSLRNGRYIRDRLVTNLRSSGIEIKGKAPAEMDGEVVNDSPLTINVVKQSLLFAGLPDDARKGV